MLARSAALCVLLGTIFTLLVVGLAPIHAASTTFGFSAADSPQQSFSISDDDAAGPVAHRRPGARAAGLAGQPSPQDVESGDGYIAFLLHGGTANVGLTLGTAKTIHVGFGEFPFGGGNAQFSGEMLPHALSLTGSAGTVTQTLPQTDDLSTVLNTDQHLIVDVHAGPTVTFDMGAQGRIDVTPQEYTYDLDEDMGKPSAPNFPYTLLLRPAAVAPSGVTTSPSSVTYPASATGTVTLAKAAPDAETLVLTSSNPAAAGVPATVPVAAGQQTVTFPIMTSRVDSDTAVTISAAAGGTTKSAVFTVKTRPEVSFTYSIAGQPQIGNDDGDGSSVTFSATGGSGTVKLALGQRYTITAGSYTVTGRGRSEPGAQLYTTVSRAVALDNQTQTLNQHLSEYAEQDEFDNGAVGIGLGDSPTYESASVVYDLGAKGRVEIVAAGFNTFSGSDINQTVPAQYTFVLLPPASATNTYYVSPTGNDDNPGTLTSPLRTVQRGIYYAGSSGTVLLEDGVYSGPGDVGLNFGGQSITLTSVHGAAKTALDCGGNSQGFFFIHGETAAVVNGLTVQHGFAPDGSILDGGGALAVVGSQVTFTNCVLSGNTGRLGGAVYNGGGLTLNGCTLTGNASSYEGGGIYSTGMLTLNGCTLTGNMAPTSAGGLYSQNTATLTACTFNGNTTGGFGGGVESQFGSMTITNCVFSGNAVRYGGAGVASSSSGLTLRFCTFAGNLVSDQLSGAPGLGAAVDDESQSGTNTITDCIFYGDMSPTGHEIATAGTVTYSDVQGGYTGTGNFSADPRFLRAPVPNATPPDYGDLRLQAGAPCIGKGIVLSGVTTDRDGKPRANPPSVGAFEYAAPPVISALSPSSAAAGGPAFTLTVSGMGFLSTSIVQWNGTALATTFVSSTQLTATVPASLIASAGTAQVTVTTPKVATSNAKTFTITAGVTVVSLTLSPTSVRGGSATSTGTITLSGPAPANGLAVKQTSSDTSAATLAPTLNIPAGATSAKFKITTYAVSSTKTVTITSAANGSSKSATLTVTH